MKRYKLPLFLMVFLSTQFFNLVYAGQAEDLAAESEAYAASTASTKAEPQMIIDQVNKACELLAREGRSAFPKFMGKGSEFLFAGTYIWIHDLKGRMIMHPIKYNMVGKDLLGLKDRNGKRIFATMNLLAEEKGEGWVSYDWQKPGGTDFFPKFSYVKMCKTANGEEVIIGCGAFDLEEPLKKIGAEIK